MSTNHNRIKVADLETNKSNKILITNEKGELEFNDVNNIQTEKYNALDCTTEGKALDARQGKVLKDMIDNVSSDQFITKTSKSFFHMLYIGDIDFVDVDDKSYLKFEQGMTGLKSLNIQDSKNLYHGREFILKNGSLTNVTIFHNLGSGNFKFNIPGANNLVLKPEESAHFVMRAINNTNNGGLIDYIGISATVDATPSVKGTLKLAGDLEGSADFPTVKGLSGKLTAVIATDSETQITQTVSEDNKIVSRSKLFNWWTWIKSQAQTISGPWNFTNKVTLAAGNTTTPSLFIPNGTLTSTLQNGAIERDSSGKLWTTRSGVRYMLTEDDGSYIKIILNGEQKIIDTPAPYITINDTKDTLLGTFNAGSLSNSFLGKLTIMASAGDVTAGGGSIAPKVNKFQIVIKFTNALLSPNYSGAGYISELVLIDNVNKTGTTATLAGTRTGWDANWGLFNGYYAYDSVNKSSSKNLNTVTAQLFCRRVIEFDDTANVNTNNQAIRAYTAITSTLVERIRM